MDQNVSQSPFCFSSVGIYHALLKCAPSVWSCVSFSGKQEHGSPMMGSLSLWVCVGLSLPTGTGSWQELAILRVSHDSRMGCSEKASVTLTQPLGPRPSGFSSFPGQPHPAIPSPSSSAPVGPPPSHCTLPGLGWPLCCDSQWGHGCWCAPGLPWTLPTPAPNAALCPPLGCLAISLPHPFFQSWAPWGGPHSLLFPIYAGSLVMSFPPVSKDLPS